MAIKRQNVEISIDKLKPYDRNPRKHSEKQIEQLASSIKEFGFTNPLLIDDKGSIIAGHGRLEAAKKLGLKKIPAVQLSGLTKAQKQALVIADNKLAENATWDDALLAAELHDLNGQGFEMPLLGFDPDELDGFLGEVKESAGGQDSVPDVAATAHSRPGDVWLMGEHRLLCGDSTLAASCNVLMRSDKAELLFTSPPYSDIRDYNGEKDLSVEKLSQFITAFKDHAEFQVVNLGLKRKDHEIVPYWDSYIAAAKAAAYKLLSWGVWARPSAGSVGNQSAFFPVTHEWIFTFGKGFKHINRCEERKTAPTPDKLTRSNRQRDGKMKKSSVGKQGRLKELESVVYLPQEMNNDVRQLHPATFPVELPEKFIKAITDEGDIVIEPFGGSGSTLIACEKTGRVCRIIELDPLYCDVIVRRWQDFTGKEATRERDGKTFNAVSGIRNGEKQSRKKEHGRAA